MKIVLVVLATLLCSCTTATFERAPDGSTTAKTRNSGSDGQSVLLSCDDVLTTDFDYEGDVTATCRNGGIVLASQGGMSDPQTAGAGFGVLGDLFAVLKRLVGL